jgi:hypothetical protein
VVPPSWSHRYRQLVAVEAVAIITASTKAAGNWPSTHAAT